MTDRTSAIAPSFVQINVDGPNDYWAEFSAKAVDELVLEGDARAVELVNYCAPEQSATFIPMIMGQWTQEGVFGPMEKAFLTRIMSLAVKGANVEMLRTLPSAVLA